MKFKVLAGCAIALAAIYVGAKVYAGRVAEQRVKEAVAKTAAIVDVSYKKVGVDFLPPRVRVSGVVITARPSGEQFKIAEVVLKDGDDKSQIPTYLSVACHGIELKPEGFFPRAKSELREMGYDKPMLMSLAIDYVYNKEAKELRLRRFGVGLDEVGRFECGGLLSRVNLEPAALVMLPFSYSLILVHEAKLTYRDDSFFDRMLKLQAKEEKKDPKELRKQLVERLTQDIDKEKDDFKKGALKEIRKFVERPGEISLAISPPKPVSIGEVMRHGATKEAIAALKVQIKAD
jgi:hypothetical protein